MTDRPERSLRSSCGIGKSGYPSVNIVKSPRPSWARGSTVPMPRHHSGKRAGS